MVVSTGYTLEYFLRYVIPIWVLFRIILNAFKYIKYRKINYIREIVINLFFTYIVILIGITILPIEIPEDWTQFERVFTEINLIPFNQFIHSINNASIIILAKNILGNAFLLSPLIIFINILHKNKINSYFKGFMYGLLVSLSIEMSQFILEYVFIPVDRCVDITDVILNVIGALIGVYIYITT